MSVKIEYLQKQIHLRNKALKDLEKDERNKWLQEIKIEKL